MERERLRSAGRLVSARHLGPAAGPAAAGTRCARSPSRVLFAAAAGAVVWLQRTDVVRVWMGLEPAEPSLAGARRIAALASRRPDILRGHSPSSRRSLSGGHTRSDDPRTAVLQPLAC